MVVGICDGGTAVSRGAIDAKMLAQLGVPTVLLCADAFLNLARISLPEKLDGVHLVIIPHPLSSLTTDETFALATPSFDDFVGSLTNGIDYNHVLETHDTKFTNDELNSLFQEDGLDDFDFGGSGILDDFRLTDGLPVFVPPKKRVNQFLKYWPDPIFSKQDLKVPPRNGVANRETVAANAIVSGMPASIAPYISSVMQAACDPDPPCAPLRLTGAVGSPVTPMATV